MTDRSIIFGGGRSAGKTEAARPFRALVTGGRDYADANRVYLHLEVLLSEVGHLLVIQGGAPGADALARAWAKSPLRPRYAIEHIREDARWTDMTATPCVRRRRRDGTLYNAAAGGIRNQLMLDQHKPDLVLAFPGGSGTADMVKRAEAAGVKVVRAG